MKTKTTKTVITRTTTETNRKECCKGKKVECIETREIFPSGAAASRAFGCTDGAVWNQINGYQTTLKGFTFRYVDEDEPCVVCRAKRVKRIENSQTKLKAELYDLYNELNVLEAEQEETAIKIVNIKKQIKIAESKLNK